MYPKPLKLTEAPHWEEDMLILQVKTIPPLRENYFTIRVSGPSAKRMEPHLRIHDLLVLFYPLALRYSVNNRLSIVFSKEKTKIDVKNGTL